MENECNDPKCNCKTNALDFQHAVKNLIEKYAKVCPLAYISKGLIIAGAYMAYNKAPDEEEAYEVIKDGLELAKQIHEQDKIEQS